MTNRTCVFNMFKCWRKKYAKNVEKVVAWLAKAAAAGSNAEVRGLKSLEADLLGATLQE